MKLCHIFCGHVQKEIFGIKLICVTVAFNMYNRMSFAYTNINFIQFPVIVVNDIP